MISRCKPSKLPRGSFVRSLILTPFQESTSDNELSRHSNTGQFPQPPHSRGSKSLNHESDGPPMEQHSFHFRSNFRPKPHWIWNLFHRCSLWQRFTRLMEQTLSRFVARMADHLSKYCPHNASYGPSAEALRRRTRPNPIPFRHPCQNIPRPEVCRCGRVDRSSLQVGVASRGRDHR